MIRYVSENQNLQKLRFLLFFLLIFLLTLNLNFKFNFEIPIRNTQNWKYPSVTLLSNGLSRIIKLKFMSTKEQDILLSVSLFRDILSLSMFCIWILK